MCISPIYILHKEVKGAYMQMCMVRREFVYWSTGANIGAWALTASLCQTSQQSFLSIWGCVTLHSPEFPSFVLFFYLLAGAWGGGAEELYRNYPSSYCGSAPWSHMFGAPGSFGEELLCSGQTQRGKHHSHELIHEKNIWELQCEKVLPDQWQHSWGPGGLLE